MKWIYIVAFLLFTGCSTVKQVPINNNTVTHVRDSVIMRDSVVISYVTKERIKDVVPIYDTLHLETDYAKSTSYVDTTKHILRGQIENKTTTPIKTKIKWQDRIVEKEVIKNVEVPVVVEVEKKHLPNIFWYSIILNVIFVALTGFRVYRKFIL